MEEMKMIFNEDFDIKLRRALAIHYGLETIDNKRVLVRHGRLRYEKSDRFKNRISRN